MKKTRKEEVPLMSIERDPMILIVSLILTAGLVFLTFQTLFNKEVMDINPLGFFLFVPTLLVAFQTLWFLLNPYVYIYADKFEVKHSLFYNKFWQINDLLKVGEVKNGNFNIQYRDEEVEAMKLFGIRRSEIKKFRDEISKMVEANLAAQK